ncbi:MAG: DUF2256 domain-containing protein [Chitinophagaceae bacterium]|nr:DUF2256 domain-containing protein [Chitinophagaceae bacterium]
MLKTERFRGNKLYLPTKVCMGCKREFTWRKSLKMTWEEVKFCSDRCRKKKNKN